MGNQQPLQTKMHVRKQDSRSFLLRHGLALRRILQLGSSLTIPLESLTVQAAKIVV
jgi:hypothetical protein